MNLRDRILAARDLGEREVNVPEWGCKLRVRGLTVAESERFEALQGESWAQQMAFVAIAGTVDEAGAPVFGPDDVEALTGKSIAALRRVSEAVLALSHSDEAADGEAGGGAAGN